MTASDRLELEGTRANAEHLREDCIHTSKNHFFYASFLRKLHYFFGVTSAVAAGIIGFVNFVHVIDGFIFIGLCSFIAIVMSAMITLLNPSKSAELNQRIGNQYLIIQKKVESLLDVELINERGELEKMNYNVETLRNEREKLYEEYSDVIVPEWIHKRVVRKIGSGETDYRLRYRN